MERRSFDWRVPVIWAVLLTLSLFAHAYVEVANEARRGNAVGLARVLMVEVASHLAVAVLLPAIYWLHRRWPIAAALRNLAIHVLGLVPFSLIHTSGMAALRLLWFAGILGEANAFPLTVERLLYEGAKDIVNYGMLSAAVVALRHLLDRVPMAVPQSIGARPERFAVRQRGRQIMVEVADIDWIEAGGNYAVLHVGADRFEVRSSLTRLEAELDPKRFVRVHKSHLVNIARVAEVTPWISGDWRIRLQDGADLNLSRRYRTRFEALAPVRS